MSAPPAPPTPLLPAIWLMVLMGLLTGCKSSSSPAGSSAKVPRIDLTQKAWFPPIVRQQGNSCAQQAGLYYLLTAERNRARGQSSRTPSGRLSPYQTYAILADNMAGGTHVTDGWHLARETGVPLETDLPKGSRGLMHGFDKYVRALRHKPDSWKLLPLRTTADLRIVKDHLAAGHPVACDFQVRGTKMIQIPGGGSLIQKWGDAGPGHTMVYAGYDDSIGWDFNGDGLITNDRDITGDGKVTLGDQERGAFLVVNPWGPRWGTGGKAWAPWREHALRPWPRAGEVAVVKAAPDAAPRQMVRLSLSLKERQDLTITVANGKTRMQPLPFRATPVPWPGNGPAGIWEVFGMVHRPGPPLSSGPLLNPAGGPLEFGFEAKDLHADPVWTLQLQTTGRPLQGTLHAAALVSLDRNGKITKEVPLSGLPQILPPGGGTWSSLPETGN